MSFGNAFRAFFKALRNPDKATKFLEDAPPKAIEKKVEEQDHLKLLALLQRSGRLVDFLKEDLVPYSDEQVGAVVRKVHEDCGKSLEEVITIRPLYEESEGAEVTIPKGFNPNEVKVVGEVKGEGPYRGRLIHKGWRAHKRALPKQVGESDPDILYAAEVEVTV